MSDSGDSDASNPELRALVDNAPIIFRISEALHRFVRDVPAEVSQMLLDMGSGIRGAQHLKTSFHATFQLQLSPPLVAAGSGDSHDKAILQVLGAQMGDKGVFGREITAGGLKRAMELGGAAGVRVPAVFGIGTCETPLGRLEFILQEMIQTATVEDKVRAPISDWQRIAGEVQGALRTMSLSNESTEPLPRYESLEAYLRFCASLVPVADAELLATMEIFIASITEAPPTAQHLVLLHQDVNDGNLLCSPQAGDRDPWQLDALIDWESAAVADPRMLAREEPWSTARAFAHVAKGSHMAAHLACANVGGAGADVLHEAPRCELMELVEQYEEGAKSLDSAGLLGYQSFLDKVALLASMSS